MRKPTWLKKKINFDRAHSTSSILAACGVNTVCREAKCPNLSECFQKKQATFLILGRSCSRHCRFCHVEKSIPQPVDEDEPKKVASAVKQLGLTHVVITSVTRDDLTDGGAAIFIETVKEIKKTSPAAAIELLIPDFQGSAALIRSVAAAGPEIIGHNLETVPRLYCLRPEAGYQTSLAVLRLIKENAENIYTKSALMLGLGEKEEEVKEVMRDLKKAGCDFLCLGQYLRPSLAHTEVKKYITPDMFERYQAYGLKLGFGHVESSPYSRSSFNAAGYLK